MFTRVAALECRRAGLPIRISSVAPGGVKTPMWRTMPFFEELVAQTGSEEAAYAALGTQPHARFAEPEEIARVVLFLASDEASFVTATEILADHGDV
jgi:NAD(P)-dependent dehydrogenase (short-subunit alcohol dehydrogenase family)